MATITNISDDSSTDDDAPLASTTEYIATGYCGFCRVQLPHNPLPVLEPRSEPWEQWESSLRAVLCTDPKNRSGCVITFPFKITGEDCDAEKTIRTPMGNVKLSFEVAMIDDTLANAFHSWCYNVFQWKTGITDPDVIYRLTTSLSHESSPWQTIGSGNGWLDPPSKITTLLGDMEERVQPGFLSRLPSELRAKIWGFVGRRSAYSSFALVSEEAARLAPKLEREGGAFLQVTKGSFVHTETIDIFGLSFLSSITNEEEKEGAVEILEDVTAIKVIASLPGVCAVKLIGKTWESDWLGRPPVAGQLWYGTQKDPDLESGLLLLYTGLTCLDIRCKEDPPLMVDRPDFPAHLVEPANLHDEAAWLRAHSNSINFEFIRYLPLFCGKEAACSLTFYCSKTGIIGMAAHFHHTTFFSGYRDGYAIYIPLGPGERITNVWYRFAEDLMRAPGLVIQTNKGRGHHIGPYKDPGAQALQSSWAPVNNYHYAYITGIFYPNPRREIYCCSVLGHDPFQLTLTQVPKLPVSQLPYVELATGVPEYGPYLSTAKFEHAREITACILEERYTGLLIKYQDGSETALGQWCFRETNPDARYESVYSYVKDAPEPASMAFRIAKADDNPFNTDQLVSKITPHFSEEVILDGVTYVPWRMGVAWWFENDYDQIVPWKEEYFEIPIERHRFVQAG